MNGKSVALVYIGSALCLAIFSVLAILLAELLIKVDVPKPRNSNNYQFCPRNETDEYAIVKIQQGFLRGRQFESAAGGSFISFQGIPYAKPPIGSLRFKDAELPTPWDGVRNAFKEGNICPQFINNNTIGNEDCLYLNVYTPRLSRRRLLPVMVWIHGGSFSSGSGNYESFGPDYLIAEGVIVVTFNYRLGPLGFLYLNKEAPGNVGMKDQVAVLRWVKENIAAFGGDSSWVTIIGHSAGAACIQLHLFSPMTKDLFQGAIAQSGTSVDKAMMQPPTTNITHMLAKEVGCPVGNDTLTIRCLREVDASALVTAGPKCRTERDLQRLLGQPFVPTVDLNVPGVQQYLHLTPLEMMKMGCQHDVPYLTGITNKEGLFLLEGYDIFNEKFQKKTDAVLKEVILPELFLPIDESRADEAVQDIRNFYLNGQRLTNKTLSGFLDMIMELHLQGISYSLKQMSRTRKSIEPLYEYSFVIQDDLNPSKIQLPEEMKGANHGDEIYYLFRVAGMPEVSENSTAALSRKRMVHLWTNFAKFGKPVILRDRILQTSWDPYSIREPNFLEIGSNLRKGKDLNKDHDVFWEEFFQKYKPMNTQIFNVFSLSCSK